MRKLNFGHFRSLLGLFGQSLLVKLYYLISKRMNKIKIKIPEQVVEVEYDLVIDDLAIPVQQPFPPVGVATIAPEPTPAPTISVGINNITEEFNSLVASGRTTKVFNEGTYEVKAIKTQNLSGMLTLAGNDTTIIFGQQNYNKWADQLQQATLFHLDNGANFYSRGVNFCQPKQIVNVEPWMPTIFSSKTDPKIKWSAVVEDCDTTKLGRNGGFGLGTLYGSDTGNLVAAINYKHLGNGFLEGKANIGGASNGILKVYLKNVVTDGANEEEFGSNRLLVRGSVKDNIFTITSNHSTSFLYNHFFNVDKGDNYAHLLHIGRFTFMIDDIGAVIDDKRIRLRPLAKGSTRIRIVNGRIYTPSRESHVNDKIGGIVMTEKGRDEYPSTLWTNNWKVNESELSYHPYLIPSSLEGLKDNDTVEWVSSFDLEGVEQDAFLISKGNDNFRTYPHTQFGKSWEILRGMIVGHNMYNHREITLYAENVIQKGYYRQTSHAGKSLGCYIIDSVGFKDEFNFGGEIKSTTLTLEQFKNLS